MASAEGVKLRTVKDILMRLTHDNTLGIDLSQVCVGYRDTKYPELQRMPFQEFKLIKDGGDIPMHHVMYIQYNELILWDKEKRLDRLCGSGNTKIEERWPLNRTNDDTTNEEGQEQEGQEQGQEQGQENEDNGVEQARQEAKDDNKKQQSQRKQKQKQKQKQKDKPQKDKSQKDKQQKSKEKKLKGTELSKTLSWILRHGAGELGLHMDKEGYVQLTELLDVDILKSKHVIFADIEKVVTTDKKQRYTMKFIDPEQEQERKTNDQKTQTQTQDQMISRYWIRTNQGHSLKSEGTIELDTDHLLKLLTVEEIELNRWEKVICHGTYLNILEDIFTSGGLNRMSRTHIHFACGDVLHEGVKSGMRTTCEILVYVDAIQCIRDGLKFQISANNVILSPGDQQGFIPTKYFWKITQFKNGKPDKILWERGVSSFPLEQCLQNALKDNERDKQFEMIQRYDKNNEKKQN